MKVLFQEYQVKFKGVSIIEKLEQLNGIMREMIPFRREAKMSSEEDGKIQNGSDTFFQFIGYLINSNYVPSVETDAGSTEVNKT